MPVEPVMQRVEPTLGEAPRRCRRAPAAPAAARRVSSRVDALIDAIATLGLEAPVPGETVIAHLPASRRAGGKPLFIEGLNTETSQWETPQACERYGELQAGVQLANRSGALNEIEYSEFVQKTQAFADALGAVPDFPDMLDVGARARELDAFAGAHDAHLAMHLQANAVAWSVGYIRQCAERHGFVPGTMPGRLVLPAAEGGRAAGAGAVFRRPSRAVGRPAAGRRAPPHAVARRGADERSGRPVRHLASGDPRAGRRDGRHRHRRRRPRHHAAALHDDRVELKTLYSALESRDMAAGSAVARRLFQ